MANQLLTLLPGALPVGFCPGSEQERLNAYMAVSNALLQGGLAFYNYGDTKPDVTLQGYPWFRTTDGRWYYFSGVWKSPMNRSSFERRLFVGTLTDLLTYDGGDNGAPSATSGPAWEESTEFRGRSPMGPGAIPTSQPAKTLNVGEDYGEGAHVLLATEFPSTLTLKANLPGNRTNLEGGAPQWLAPIGSAGALLTTPTTEDATFPFQNDGGDVAHQTTHPVHGCYVIKPTNRQFYTVT